MNAATEVHVWTHATNLKRARLAATRGRLTGPPSWPTARVLVVHVVGGGSLTMRNPMDMLEITGSSNIKAIGWAETHVTPPQNDADDATHFGKLRVHFKSQNGKGSGLYEYDDVPRSTFDALQTSHSPGSYFSENIKGQFKYRKIEAEFMEE